jgi:uncharacterized protein YcaQ
VKAAWSETTAGPAPQAGHVAAELADELHLMAGWLGLGGVAVEDRGDLAVALTAAVALRGRLG